MIDPLESLEKSFLGVFDEVSSFKTKRPENSIPREKLFEIWGVGKHLGYEKLREAIDAGLINEHRVLEQGRTGVRRYVNYYTVAHVSVD